MSAAPGRARAGKRPRRRGGSRRRTCWRSARPSAGAALREEGPAQPHPDEVRLGRVEARERHRPQRRDRVGRAPRGQERVAALEEEASPLRSAPRGKLAGEGDEARPGLLRLRGRRVLPVEPVEGRGGRGAIAEGEVGLPEAEQGGGRLARAGRDDLLEGGHGGFELSRLPEELPRLRERRARDGARGLVPRGEVGAGRGFALAQGLLRAAEREERVVPEEGPLDVRVRQLGERVGGAARFDEAQAREEPREAGRRGPREPLGDADERARRRRAVAHGGVAQRPPRPCPARRRAGARRGPPRRRARRGGGEGRGSRSRRARAYMDPRAARVAPGEDSHQLVVEVVARRRAPAGTPGRGTSADRARCPP